jgi:hypothetical protein
MITITEPLAETLIIGCAILGILFGIVNSALVLRVKVITPEDNVMGYKDDRHLERN